ncbi:beta-propeller fold lactonase family protein [Marinomonas transparens]|uniref:Beta-propeller fold lactonase family protein n=1 Tax=Marinomonas transparens TaxID=2795388 RepID=A0A934MY73_9GAMM|nr:beta-propeller fold lactonase family protein [Marinomonas transparens]MBJ7536155.1 beta-propeller fold lactonase family protein [Marinomonas transparens]
MFLKRKSSSSLSLMLEPRLMFDAAAVETAITTESTSIEYVDQSSTDVGVDGGIDLLKGANDLVFSADGKFAYSVRAGNDDSWDLEEYSSSVSVYSVEENGTLTAIGAEYNLSGEFNWDTAEFDSTLDIDGLAGASIVRLSEDQNFLYVYGETDNSMVVFSRDTTTGELTLLGNTDLSEFGIDNTTTFVEDVTASNGYLYIAGADSVFVLSTQGDGTLSLEHSYSNETDGVEGLTGARRLLVSEDGSTMFVGGSGDDSVLTLFSIEEDGALTYISSVEGTANAYYIQSIAVSSDGETIFALNEDNGASLLTMVFDGTDLVLKDSYEVSADARDIITTEDGTGVLVLGNNIDVFSQSGSTLSKVSTIYGNNNDLTSFSGIKTASLSADGSKLIVVGADAVRTFEFAAPSVSYTEGGDASVVLPKGLVSDAELGTLEDYNGASYTFARQSGVLPEDSFDFIEANGFELTRTGDIEFNYEKIATFSVVDNQLTVTFTSSVSQQVVTDVLRQITYSSTSNDPVVGSRSVEFVVTLDDGIGNESTLNVTTPLEVALLPTGLVSDSELDALDNYNGASYHIARESGASPEDSFGFLETNGLTLSGDKIVLDNSEIATFALVNNELTVTFTSSVSQQVAQDVLRQITYFNTSNDPAANDSSPVFVITLDDGDGNQSKTNVTVDLVGVNNPATLETTALTPTYHLGDDYTPLFQNTSIDTIEADQPVNQIVLTFDNATSDDVLKVGSAKISFDSMGFKNINGFQYRLTLLDSGETEVLIYLPATTTAEEVASTIDSITYKYNGSDVGGQKNVTLTINERVVSGDTGEISTTFSEGNAVITLAAAEQENEAPSMASSVDSVSYTENTAAVPVFTGTTISDTQMDSYNGGLGNYHGATLVVSVDSDSSDHVLEFTEENGLSVVGNDLLKDGVVIGSFLNKDGTLTITFTEDNGSIPTTSDVQNALSQVQYLNESDSPDAKVDITATLTDQAGLSGELVMQVNVVQVNDAPTIAEDPLLSVGDIDLIDSLSEIDGLGDITSSTVTSDGSTLYVSDSAGNIAVYLRDTDTGEWVYQATHDAFKDVAPEVFEGLPTTVSEVVVSSDGQSLYVLSSNNKGSILTVLSVTETHELVLTQTLTNGDEAEFSFSEIKELVVSEDGKNLYFFNAEGLAVMSRDSATGELTFVEEMSNDAWNEPFLFNPSSITVTDDYVFVTATFTDNTLIVLERTDSGLDWVAYIRNGSTDTLGSTVSMSSINHIVATEDGSIIYLMSNEGLQTFSYDADNKQLTFVSVQELAVDNVTDVALNEENNQLYVLASDASLVRYLVGEDGGLILIDTVQQAPLGNDGELSVLEDGSVFVQGSDLTIYQVETVEEPKYAIGDEPVLVFPTADVFDVELNRLDSYSGFSLTINRADGDTEDHFGLLAGGDFSIDGERLLYLGNEVGSLTQSNGDLVITITSALTQFQVNSLIRSLTFENASLAEDTVLSFSMVANDGTDDSEVFTVTVDAVDNEEPVLSDLSSNYALPTATVGVPFSLVIPESLVFDADGDELSWSLSGLPSGVAFDPTTLTLSGVTSSTGEFSLLLTASDVFNKSVQLTLSLEVVMPVIDEPVINDPVVEDPVVEDPVVEDPVVDLPIPVVANTGPITDFSPVQANDTFAESQGSQSSGFTRSQISSAVPLVSTPVSSNAVEVSVSQVSTPSFSDNATVSASSFSTLPVEPFVQASVTFSASADNAQYSLVDSVLSIEEKQIDSVSMADGSALPEGVTFDAKTLQLNVSKGALKAGETLELQILVTDKEGNQSLVPLVLDVQGEADTTALQGSSEATDNQETSAGKAVEGANAAAALTQQVKAASQLAVAEKSRQLLAELSAN